MSVFHCRIWVCDGVIDTVHCQSDPIEFDAVNKPECDVFDITVSGNYMSSDDVMNALYVENGLLSGLDIVTLDKRAR